MWTSAALIWPLGLAALLVCAWRGRLRADALRGAPVRDVGLTGSDLVVALALMILGKLLVNVVVLWWVGVDESGVPLTRTTLQYMGLVVVGQALGQGPAVGWLLWRAWGADRGWRTLGLWPPRGVGAGVLGLLVALPVVMSVLLATAMIGYALAGDPPPRVGHDLLKTLQESDSAAGTALLLFSAVVIAPVLEELVYRGLLQTGLVSATGWRLRWPAILVTSLIFTVVHGTVVWQALPGLFVLSLILGWLYERTGSLWPCVTTHAGFNAMNIALLLTMPTG